MRSPFLLSGALASLSVMGCAVAPSVDGPDAEATASTASAVVVVERSMGPGDSIARGDAVVARFVRVRQGVVDGQALRMAGVAQDLPALGTCSTPTDEDVVLQPRAVELLDVGPVSLEDVSRLPGRARTTVLLPRAMPDPAGVVSGVFYSARSGDAYAAGGGVTMQLRASGGPDLVDGFLVNVASPHDVTDVRVASTANGLDVSWDATDADARDLVYIDVVAGTRLVSRCTTLDVGRLLVPSSAVGTTRTTRTTEEGQISVHRLHRESFRAKGIEPGEVRFDVARVVTFRR